MGAGRGHGTVRQVRGRQACFWFTCEASRICKEIEPFVRLITKPEHTPLQHHLYGMEQSGMIDVGRMPARHACVRAAAAGGISSFARRPWWWLLASPVEPGSRCHVQPANLQPSVSLRSWCREVLQRCWIWSAMIDACACGQRQGASIALPRRSSREGQCV